MKKATSKKILGGTLILSLLATIGAVLVTAETDDFDEDERIFPRFESGKMMGDRQPFFSELTEEQKEEINDLREQITTEDATTEEIRTAIMEKLEEFGIELPDRDVMLDEQIQQTTQHLEILELKKELREEGYSWEEIQDVISEEYDLDPPMRCHGMMGMRGGMGRFGGGEFPMLNNEIAEDSEV